MRKPGVRSLVTVAITVTCAGGLLSATMPGSTASPLARARNLAPAAVPAGSTAIGSLPADDDDADRHRARNSPACRARAAMLAALTDPSSPDYHHWLTPSAFAADFGPSATEVATAESWLRDVGLSTVSARRSQPQRHHHARGQLDQGARRALRPPPHLASRWGGVPSRRRPPSSQRGGRLQTSRASSGLDDLPEWQPLARAGRPLPSPHTIEPATPPSQKFRPTPCVPRRGPRRALDDDGPGRRLLRHQRTQRRRPHRNRTDDRRDRVRSPRRRRRRRLRHLLRASRTRCTTEDPATGTVSSPSGGTGTVEADLDIEEAETQAPGAAVISYEVPNDGHRRHRRRPGRTAVHPGHRQARSR